MTGTVIARSAERYGEEAAQAAGRVGFAGREAAG